MNGQHSFFRWLMKVGAFLGTCVPTSVLMRLLMSAYDSMFSLPYALLALISSGVLGWHVIRRWRFVSPLRCASELGICGAIGGSGLFILFCYGIAYLFTPSSSLQSP
jgi:hypothetical protein